MIARFRHLGHFVLPETPDPTEEVKKDYNHDGLKRLGVTKVDLLPQYHP